MDIGHREAVGVKASDVIPAVGYSVTLDGARLLVFGIKRLERNHALNEAFILWREALAADFGITVGPKQSIDLSCANRF